MLDIESMFVCIPSWWLWSHDLTSCGGIKMCEVNLSAFIFKRVCSVFTRRALSWARASHLNWNDSAASSPPSSSVSILSSTLLGGWAAASCCRRWYRSCSISSRRRPVYDTTPSCRLDSFLSVMLQKNRWFSVRKFKYFTQRHFFPPKMYCQVFRFWASFLKFLLLMRLSSYVLFLLAFLPLFPSFSVHWSNI